MIKFLKTYSFFQILFKKIEKVEDCVHDARLVKNLSLIVQNNMSKVSTNAITFRHEDFSKKIIEMLEQHKKEGDGPGMNKVMLIKLGLQVTFNIQHFISFVYSFLNSVYFKAILFNLNTQLL